VADAADLVDQVGALAGGGAQLGGGLQRQAIGHPVQHGVHRQLEDDQSLADRVVQFAGEALALVVAHHDELALDVAHRFLGASAFGDVSRDSLDGDDVPAAMDRRGGQLDRDAPPVLAEDFEIERLRQVVFAANPGGGAVHEHLVVFRRRQLAHVHPQQFVPRVAGHDLRGGVGEGVVALQVHREDHVVGVVDDVLEAFVRLVEHPLGASLVGDVADVDRQGDGYARAVEDGVDVIVQDPAVALVLEACGLARAEDFVGPAAAGAGQLRRHQVERVAPEEFFGRGPERAGGWNVHRQENPLEVHQDRPVGGGVQQGAGGGFLAAEVAPRAPAGGHLGREQVEERPSAVPAAGAERLQLAFERLDALPQCPQLLIVGVIAHELPHVAVARRKNDFTAPLPPGIAREFPRQAVLLRLAPAV